MNETQPPDDPRPLEHEPITAGLRAAFGPETEAPFVPPVSVISAIEVTIGVPSRVMLRDTPDEQSPLVKPRTGETAQAAKHPTRYQIVGEIARGGVGVVLKSRDVDLGRDVAMKILRPDHEHNPAMLQRFVEEAQIAGQLQHPGILPVYELGLQDAARPFFTMKLVRGKTLAALLADRADPAEDRQHFLNIFEHVCQTIAYAHARGVIHRDIKPANVMVGSFGEVQVVDWGLAKVLAQGGTADERQARAKHEPEQAIETVRSSTPTAHSMTGSVMGTPAYMPPEQARGEIEDLDERADVFALGAMLCEILTGEPPYTVDRQLILQHAAETRIEECQKRLKQSGADHQMIKLANDCLAAAKNKRPRDAGAVAKRVSDYLQSLEAKAHQMEIAAAEASARAAEERRSRRLTTALATCVMFVIFLISGGAFWFKQNQQHTIDRQSARVDASIDNVAMLLGQAKAAGYRDREAWVELDAGRQQLEQNLAAGRVSGPTAQRARAFIDELDTTQRDHRFINRLEETAVQGLANKDRESWQWMKDEFEAAFTDYGIDLKGDRDHILKRIRASEFSDALAYGLDMWIRSCTYLKFRYAAGEFTFEDLRDRIDTLFQADTDPVRLIIRQQTYAQMPNRDLLLTLMDRDDFKTYPAQTYLLLLSAYYRIQDIDAMQRLSHTALARYPDHFLLNFNYAYFTMEMGRPAQAVPYFRAAVAIRPNVAGIWTLLAQALQKSGNEPDALAAFRRAAELQPELELQDHK